MSKTWDVKQGTEAWVKARLGKPTASAAKYIVQNKSGNLSASAHEQEARYILERISGELCERKIGDRFWVDRGLALEDEALQAFAQFRNLSISRGKFVTTDDGKIGCSPDATIDGRNQIVEVKCPAPWTHIEYLLYGPGDDYFAQMQMQIYVGGYERVFFWSYHPDFRPAIYEVEPIPEYQAKLDKALTKFCADLDAHERGIREMMTRRNAPSA